MVDDLRDPELLESGSLRLLHACRAVNEAISNWLSARLADRGYIGVSGAQLSFLAELECGKNHAAEIARRMGVSRQAVHKNVKDLVGQGILVEGPDPERRNQRVITFTAAGTNLMSDCRVLLKGLDGIVDSGRNTNVGAAGLAAQLEDCVRRIETDIGKSGA